MSSSDVEMVDPGHSEREAEGLQRVQVAADCKRGPERLSVKGKRYVWKQHEDNQRAECLKNWWDRRLIRQLEEEEAI